MRFDKDVKKYFMGELFASGLEVDISRAESAVTDRLSAIEKIVAGKDIIHLGAADHVSLIERKREKNTWLHGRLKEKAGRCLGVDINMEGIKYLKDKLRINDVVCADLLNNEIPEIEANTWDYLVMGEVLEHIDNPVLFLSHVHKKYKYKINKLIITVPNAFCQFNFKSLFNHKEIINTDHRYWFTPYTLGKIIILSGMEPEGFKFCETVPKGGDWKLRSKIGVGIKNMLIKKFPALRETLLMVVRV